MDDLKQPIKNLNALLKPYLDLARVRLDKPKAFEQIEHALQRVPPSAPFVASLEQALEQMRTAVASGNAGREQGFRRLEADYIRARREAGASAKELDQGWRVGHLELSVNRSQSKARVLFNREVVIDWSPVRDGGQLEKLMAAAEAKLKRAEIPVELLREALEMAYENARRGRSSPRVPMPDLYKAFRVALVQRELKSGNPDKKLVWAECPRWAFLYNLDRYRQLGSTAGEERLTFETGSQQDQVNGLGMTLNGLSPEQEYKVCCWVLKSEHRA